ncbi:hypothetical protein [Meiothermus taiwanensis]|uniref:hypothetical protein n=1 Tax=Meiothermus taiwanensis TaxID=172827 RepID=UPI0005B6E829|nr:hypothetical protein [Meiothermus taiwanensis]KIQ55370.1 hypothetical protein SY28_03950 [Meiothermus taiwanensis]
MKATARPAALEDSPESFWERFAQYAQTWPVSPEPLGSPVLEVLTPWGVLYLFDRGITPFFGGEASLLIHGQVVHWEAASEAPAIEHLGGGRYKVRGRVEALLDNRYFLLGLAGAGQENRLHLVLAGSRLPELGTPIQAHLAPPLMAFRSEVSR